MDAATLYTQYANFSLPSLKLGYVDSFFSRGLGELLAQMLWQSHKGKTHDFNITKARPSGVAARDPMDTTQPVSGKGQTHLVPIYPGSLMRDFDTAIYADGVMSDQQDQLVVDSRQSAESFFEEFLLQFFHGDGTFQEKKMGETPKGDNLCGLDWWLDQYAGKVVSGAFSGSTRYYDARYRGQKVFANDTGLPTTDAADQQVFGYEHVDAAKSLIKGRKDNLAIVSDRLSYLRFLKTLRAAGGNTTQMQVGEERVADVIGYDNTPWYISDTCGAAKEITGASGVGGTIAVGDKDVLIINGEGADSFIGWSDLDINRVVTVATANFATGADSAAHATAVDPVTGLALASNQSLIKQVISNRSVLLEHNAVDAVTDKTVTSNPQPTTYILRWNPTQLLGAIYSEQQVATEQTYNVNLDNEYYGTIAGFDLRNLGIVQAGGAQVRFRAWWFGQFVCETPFNIVRISNYKLR